jgi:hypothetical protein
METGIICAVRRGSEAHQGLNGADCPARASVLMLRHRGSSLGVERCCAQRGEMLCPLTCPREVAQRDVHVAKPPEGRLGRYVARKDISSQDGKVRLGRLRGFVSWDELGTV